MPRRAFSLFMRATDLQEWGKIFLFQNTTMLKWFACLMQKKTRSNSVKTPMSSTVLREFFISQGRLKLESRFLFSPKRKMGLFLDGFFFGSVVPTYIDQYRH